MFIAELDGLTLKPDQKTAVDGIQADLKKADEAQEASRQKLMADTADGIAAGKVDHKKTDADVKALVAAVTATTPTVQDALNRLYKTLDADQRKKLVEGLREKGKAMQERMAKAAGDGDKGHDGHDGAAHGEGPEHGGMRGGRMMKLVEELGLTPEQHKKLDPQLRDKMKAQRAAMKTRTEADMKHMMAIGDAFQGDKFDAKKAGVGAQAAEVAKARATNRLAIVETILAVLTPEQRTKFADQMRARADEQQAPASEDDADDLGFTTAAM
jgi:Spy/CpxP family protein refolding chaperone